MGFFFLAITASIVQRMERLLCLLRRNKQVNGELFLSHVFVNGELSNVALFGLHIRICVSRDAKFELP